MQHFVRSGIDLMGENDTHKQRGTGPVRANPKREFQLVEDAGAWQRVFQLHKLATARGVEFKILASAAAHENGLMPPMRKYAQLRLLVIHFPACLVFVEAGMKVLPHRAERRNQHQQR